jgi:OHCU decarboxylase
VTLDELNTSDEASGRTALMRCCGSVHWADAILARRPFATQRVLEDAATEVWWELTTDDWREAFHAHPKIGSRQTAGWSSGEQSGVASASERVLEELAKGNAAYEQRFGWIFLVNATGKSAADILRILKDRLYNDTSAELRVAAGEQAAITRIRLRKLLDE